VTGCTNRSPIAADAIEDEVHEVLAICGDDAIAALRMALMANAFLNAEIDRLSAAISSGFLRGVRNSPHRKKLSRKIRTDDVQTAKEAAVAVTYYVAVPFIRTEDGTAPGEACQSEAAAIRRAQAMSRDPANAGAVAFNDTLRLTERSFASSRIRANSQRHPLR
jgi:hypothetical protein